MAEFSNDTKKWLSQADQGKKPFAKIYDHGTLILSMVRDSEKKINENIQNKGIVCWRVVEQQRRRKLRVTARVLYNRIILDSTEKGVNNNSINFEINLYRPHPETHIFDDKDFSCRFNVDNTGYEDIESSCSGMRDVITSSFFAEKETSIPQTLTDLNDVPTADILVITALKDERDAFINVCKRHQAVFHPGKDSSGFPFHWTKIKDDEGTERTFVIVRALEMGETDTTAVASRLIADLSRNAPPRCIVMSGICAGRPKKTFFGDVVVADKLCKFDEGKIEVVKDPKTNEKESTVFRDITTFILDPKIKVSLEEFIDKWQCQVSIERPKSLEHQLNWLLWTLYEHEEFGSKYPSEIEERDEECRNWQDVVYKAEEKGLITINAKIKLTKKGNNLVKRLRVSNLDKRPIDKEKVSAYIGTMGTNAMVQKDQDLFYGIQRLLRYILGVEMEAAAIGNVSHQNTIPFIVAKSVVDYADMNKDDNFRLYACETSADFLLSFLLEHGVDAGIFRKSSEA